MSYADRAVTPEQKREVTERLLAAWLRSPEQRLGQLIVNMCGCEYDLFYVEDFQLARLVEEMVAPR